MCKYVVQIVAWEEKENYHIWMNGLSHESTILELTALGKLVDSASLDRLLATFHILGPNWHSYPNIHVLFLPIDFEEAECT